MMTLRYLTICLLFITSWTNAQQRIQIRDFNTLESIPFVKVIPDVDAPVLSDIDGFFLLKSAQNTQVKLRCSGYRDTLVSFTDSIPAAIYLRPFVQQVSEVTAQAGENPAERIMRLVIENRKKNNPTNDLSFQYNSYSKFYMSIDPNFTDTIKADTKDTLDRKLKRFVDSMNLFQIESTSTRKFMPPFKNKEIITSYKVSGFTDPMFSTFFNQLQSFSFYENSFEILGDVYINPIAFGGINRYLFIIEDTTLNASDTTFTISFRPRKGKNFDGINGKLFINTNGYAIEKVIAEPYRADSAFTIKIVQEYEFRDGKRWFPSKLSSEFVFHNMPVSVEKYKPDFVGKGNTYLSDIQLNPPLSRKDFDQIDIETAVGAAEKTDQEWDSLRLVPITQKERNTYMVIDSISKAENFDRALRAIKILTTGKIPLGKFNLDLKRLYTYNEFEGNRLGLGIETSDKLMKRITLGTFGGYGFHDKVFKYGGFADFNLYPRKNLFLKLNYSYDAFERGGIDYLVRENRFDTYEQLRRFFIRNMDYSQRAEAVIRGYFLPRVQFQLFGNYQRISLASDYRFSPDDSTIFRPDEQFDVAEVGIEFSWQFREKIMQLGYERKSMGSKFPILNAKLVKGIKGIESSNYDYFRLNASLSHIITLHAYGKLTWQLNAGKTIGSVPLPLLHTAAATATKKFSISVPNSFETILPSTFYADQHINLFFRYTLPEWKVKAGVCMPQLSLYQGAGYGSMQHKEQHNVSFQSMDKGYFEAGLILDKLYISSITGLGIGVFSNYGYYSNPVFEKNLVYKLSLSFAL